MPWWRDRRVITWSRVATRYNWLADTDSKAFEVLVELQRKMSAGDKLAAVLQMAGMMLRAGL